MFNSFEQLFELLTKLIDELIYLQKNIECYSRKCNEIIQDINDHCHKILDSTDTPLWIYDNAITNIVTAFDLTKKINYELQEYNSKCSGKIITNVRILPGLEALDSTDDICTSANNFSMVLDGKEEEITTTTSNTSGIYTNDEADFVVPNLDLIKLYKVDSIIEAEVTFVDIEKSNFYVLDTQSPNLSSIPEIAQCLNLTQFHDIPPENEIFGLAFDNRILRAVRSSISFYDNELDEEFWPCYLLDSGQIVQLQTKDVIYKLTQQQQQIPAQAIQCRLISEDKDFSLQKKLMERTDVHLKITKVNVNYLEVSIIGQNNTTKSKTTPNHPMPIKIANVFLPKTKQEKSTANILTPDEVEELYDEPLGTSNIMIATMGYDPQDKKRICRHYNPKTGGCFKGANCRLEHTPFQPEGWTKDVIVDKSIVDDKYPKIIYRKGEIINITPTFVGELGMFYAQINDHNKTNPPLIWTDEYVPKWKLLEKPPLIHELVLCRYSLDGCWYRAKIIAQDDNHKLFKVFYVDYGNNDLVPLKYLAKCDKGVARIPDQAVPCFIAGITKAPIDRDQLKNGIELLVNMILNKNINVKVFCHVEDLIISFVDEPFASINNILIKNKYMIRCKPKKNGRANKKT